VLLSTNGSTTHEDARLAAAIAALPERQRLAIFLRYYADLDYAAIADALGISRGTVAATLHAARASLKELYEEVAAR
jgi:RNA polymerase sigma-70 factor (ECF subfamily)